MDNLQLSGGGTCDHCPVSEGVCISLRTSGRGICGWFDPGSPRFKPGAAEMVKSQSLRAVPVAVSGRWMHSTWHDTARELAEEQSAGPGAEGAPRASRTAPRAAPGHGVPPVLLADDGRHAQVWEAARTCPHRIAEEGCCGPRDKCGPGGAHAGLTIDVGSCYPCTVKRLDLGDEPVVHTGQPPTAPGVTNGA